MLHLWLQPLPFIQAASTILAKHSVNRKSNWSFFKTSDHLGFHTTLWFTLVDFIDFTPPKTNMDTQKTTNEKVKQNASTLGSSSLANSKSSLVTLESFRFSNLAVFFVKCCRSCQCTGVSTPYNISCDARGALHPHTDSGMLLYLWHSRLRMLLICLLNVFAIQFALSKQNKIKRWGTSSLKTSRQVPNIFVLW